jgi:hypothetical protein
MQLVQREILGEVMLTIWTQMNNKYFTRKSRLAKKEWISHIQSNAVAGKVIGDKPYIDEDWFVSHNNPCPVARPKPTIDLLG